MSSEILIDREEFAGTLKTLGQCAVTDKAIPMSGYVRITTRGDRMKVEARTELASMRIYTGLLKDSCEQSFCVGYKELASIVSLVKDDCVRLIPEDECMRLRIRHESGSMSLPCAPASDFPDFTAPTDSITAAATLPSRLFESWMSVAGRFSATDDLRPVLNGMHIHMEGDTVTVSASDGHLLFNDTETVPGQDCRFDIIVGSRAFSAIASVTGGADTFVLKTDQSKAWFVSGSTTLCVTLTEGRFPNVKAVIPASSPMHVTLDREALAGAMKRIGVIVKMATPSLKLTFGDDGILSIEHDDADFAQSVCETLRYSSDGEPAAGFRIAFSYKCLMKIMEAVSSGCLEMLLTAADKAAVFRESDVRPDKTLLLMPLILTD